MRRKESPRDTQGQSKITCPSDHNVLSCILIHFLEKFSESHIEIPRYSKDVVVWLANEFNGFEQRLKVTRQYVEMLERELKSLAGTLLEYKFRLETPLSIHTRWPYLPIEIGISWHPILDVPYIPGSSIKGAVRAYAEIRNLDCAEIFGTEETSGEVVFLDAFPTDATIENGKPKVIDPDILSPHYRADIMAEDRVSPTPLVYPVVAPNVEFTFLILVRSLNYQKCVGDSVVGALTHGLGAKVSIGYGIFRTSPNV